MEARISFITLGVKSVRRSRAFYENVLGFKPSSMSKGDIVFFPMNAGSMILALYPYYLLAQDGKIKGRYLKSFRGVTLSHNVKKSFEVDAVLERVKKKKGRILKPAEDTFWGGRSGYFADPDGNAWEVAWNPHMKMKPNGLLSLKK